MTRREFVGRLSAGCLAAALPGAVVACAGERRDPSSMAGAVVVDSSTCRGFATLGPDQRQTRRSFGYVDSAPAQASNCSNCRFFSEPAGGPCGGCSLFQGPVSPGGWCRSWAPTPAA